MTKVYVQFSDSTESVISSVFGGPQDPGEYPNQAELPTTDIRYLTYMDPRSTILGAKSAKIQEISFACQEDIFKGFHSSALGSDHLYPSKTLDQTNLVASVTSSLYPGLPTDWETPFWCADSSSVWAYVMHSASQIQKVGEDGKARILACLTQNQVIQTQISAASSLEEVQAITWVSVNG